MLDEELESRPHIFNQGVRDLSDIVNLPPNNFQLIDSNVCAVDRLSGRRFNPFCSFSLQAANYDDMRACCICKHICIFSAVACECNKTRVSCTRHYTSMCKCPKEKKFLLGESTGTFASNLCLICWFVLQLGSQRLHSKHVVWKWPNCDS